MLRAAGCRAVSRANSLIFQFLFHRCICCHPLVARSPTESIPMLRAITLLLVVSKAVQADFHYADFNQSLGLVFNGDATLSDCNEKHDGIIGRLPSPPRSTIDTSSSSSSSSGMGDVNFTTSLFLERGEVAGVQTRSTVETNVDDETSSWIVHREATFGHRNNFTSSIDTGCPTRLRLTNSHQGQVGSIWYEKRLPVLMGFETSFSFQVTDHSRTCSEHVDPSLSSNRLHRSCAVHGGDGFAFVIHVDGRDTAAIGHDGEDLGYGGMNNSLAIEFDLWTNVASQQNSDDLFADHISIHSGSEGRNNPGEGTALGYAAAAADLADGKVHRVSIVYLPYVEQAYFPKMTANQNLLPYLLDNGEGRRLGTLAVFLDDGIETNQPILAIPLNLSVLLNLPQGLAYVGFTGSTGLKWEKHDVLDWKWCNEKCL